VERSYRDSYRGSLLEIYWLCRKSLRTCAVLPKAPPHFLPPLMLGIFATAIDVGLSDTCVIVNGGGVKCWGSNEYGKLGINSTILQQHTPVDMGLGSGVCIT
jgi:hypothetical protein